jgi:hypothetical protein
MSHLILHTDASARELFGESEQWETEDAVDHGARPTIAMLQTIADVRRAYPLATLQVARDWEGCPVIVCDGPDGPMDVLALTETGRIGFGGINMPRYFDSFADLMASRTYAEGPDGEDYNDVRYGRIDVRPSDFDKARPTPDMTEDERREARQYIGDCSGPDSARTVPYDTGIMHGPETASQSIVRDVLYGTARDSGLSALNSKLISGR